MSCTSVPFQSLPFPELFKDYISQNPKLSEFFSGSPFSDSEIEKKIETFRFTGNRKKTVELLKDFNQQFNPPAETIQSLNKLSDEKSFAVVTGQQLILYGGPVFTIYKVLTAIELSNKWQKKYNKPFVPVFWLADEDHDFEEVSKIGFPGTDEFNEINIGALGEGNETAGELSLNGSFSEFRKSLEESQIETEFSRDLWKALDDFYSSGEKLRTAFGRLLLFLFGKHGLVLAGSNDQAIKNHVVQPLQKSVVNYKELYKSLQGTTRGLVKKGYQAQVQVQESNLFWIDEYRQRKKINVKDNRWAVEKDGREWSTEQLSKEIEKQPHRFSPNVFLRPVVQDTLLPSITYIGGPGEIAYYSQMKNFYRNFDMEMPLIFPRFSATVLESGIDRIKEKLPFSFPDYFDRIEDLESRYIQNKNSVDVEQLFAQWKNRTDELTKEIKTKIGEIDPTLAGSAGKAKAVYLAELDKLKGKIYRSIKQQEKIQLERLHKIKNNINPNKNLQEREVAFIYFMNKYGLDIWDIFAKHFEDEIPDSHKLIRL
ncbi:MAG: bacillithiol biosynthesis cysteine-adding enzyme BshC [Balneolaceae bacterium]